MKAKTGALIIGGNLNGLSIARSLGRQGIPVWLTTSSDLKLASCSRYVKKVLPWPGADDHSKAAHLLTLADQHQLDRWVLYPTSDETAAFLAKFHAVLSRRFLVSTPAWEVLRWAYDKRLTYQFAAEQSVVFPKTFCPASEDDLRSADINFPVILKPATHEVASRLTKEKAWPAADRKELLSRYRDACRAIPHDLILVQERIPGGGESQFSFAALCHQGQPIASLTARRARQYPVDFGYSSSFVETIDVPEIEAPSRRLLAAIEYSGIVEIEYKRDPRDGRYKLLDINPRLWTWAPLGAQAGVDFPYLLWRALTGEPVTKRTGRAGARWVRMSTDIPSAIHQVLRGRLSVQTYLRSLQEPIQFALFAADDPLPAFLDIPLFLYKHLRKVISLFSVPTFRAKSARRVEVPERCIDR